MTRKRKRIEQPRTVGDHGEMQIFDRNGKQIAGPGAPPPWVPPVPPDRFSR